MRRQLSRSPYGTLFLKEMIGKGSYGQIYKAYSDSQDKYFAVKIITSDSEPDFLMNIYRQIKILMSCNHTNIVKCHSVEIVDQMVWIVMDYYSRGSLADIMAKQKRTFSQPEIQSILGQVTRALAYLHGKNIIHRDIKAANVLVDNNGEIKVADFGVSTLVSHSHKHTRTGSPLWMSPQLLSNSNYSYKTDIWSLGITALELAQGVPPYSHQHPYRAIFSIQSHPPSSLTEQWKWSEQFNNFVSQCLTLDQKKRPSAAQLQKHEFFNRKISTMKNANETNLLSTKAMRNSDFEQNNLDVSNCDTVILHSSLNTSIWEKSMNSSRISESLNDENNLCGTFKVKTNQSNDMNMTQCLLAQITKVMPLCKKQNVCPREQTVQGLYQQMQEQIMKIRKKYMTKIKKLQQKSLLTFEQEIKKSKLKNSS